MRDEDALDEAKLGSWLLERSIAEPPVSVRQFKGGASNLTYLVTDSQGQNLVLRTPPHGVKATGAHDMSREARVMSALSQVLDQVPTVFGHCGDPDILGTDFYVMEFISGHILNDDIPAELSSGAADNRELCESMVDSLARLHAVDIDAVGLAGLDKGPGYVSRQVSGWSTRYRNARTPDVPVAEDLMSWLEENQPVDVAHCLIHGDWRLDNLVINGNREIIGILDWEMSTVGDPCMDLGAALAYWVQADDSPEFSMMRLQPSHLPGMLTRSEIIARYSSQVSPEVAQSLEDHWVFYETYGLFRLAVIVQQIWARYQSGATTNPQFAGFGVIVTMLIERALTQIAAESEAH